MMTGAGTGVTHLQAREHQGLLATTGSKGELRKEPLRGSTALLVP